MHVARIWQRPWRDDDSHPAVGHSIREPFGRPKCVAAFARDFRLARYPSGLAVLRSRRPYPASGQPSWMNDFLRHLYQNGKVVSPDSLLVSGKRAWCQASKHTLPGFISGSPPLCNVQTANAWHRPCMGPKGSCIHAIPTCIISPVNRCERKAKDDLKIRAQVRLLVRPRIGWLEVSFHDACSYCIQTNGLLGTDSRGMCTHLPGSRACVSSEHYQREDQTCRCERMKG